MASLLLYDLVNSREQVGDWMLPEYPIERWGGGFRGALVWRNILCLISGFCI